MATTLGLAESFLRISMPSPSGKASRQLISSGCTPTAASTLSNSPASLTEFLLVSKSAPMFVIKDISVSKSLAISSFLSSSYHSSS